MLKNVPVSERYRSALWTALVFSLISGLVDCSDPRLPAIGLAVFWGAVVVIILRRPQNPTRFDRLLIQWGCLPFVVGFATAIECVWHWRGLM